MHEPLPRVRPPSSTYAACARIGAPARLPGSEPARGPQPPPYPAPRARTHVQAREVAQQRVGVDPGAAEELGDGAEPRQALQLVVVPHDLPGDGVASRGGGARAGPGRAVSGGGTRTAAGGGRVQSLRGCWGRLCALDVAAPSHPSAHSNLPLLSLGVKPGLKWMPPLARASPCCQQPHQVLGDGFQGAQAVEVGQVIDVGNGEASHALGCDGVRAGWCGAVWVATPSSRQAAGVVYITCYS
jgi:hypothetical protein